jgi:serine protease
MNYFKRAPAALVLALCLHSFAFSAPGPYSSPTEQIIIKFKDPTLSGEKNPELVRALSALAGTPLTFFRRMSGDAEVYRLNRKRNLELVTEISQQILLDESVEYAEPDRIVRAFTTTPNDTHYALQWHYGSGAGGIGLPSAWDISTGTSSVVAAVLDTGIIAHPDLVGRYLAGYDFITSSTIANDGDARDSDPTDAGDSVAANECYAGSPASNSSWHGSHVAGTVGASSNNSAGVTGVDWSGSILPLRVLGKCGGTMSDISDAIRWAAGLAVAGVSANTNAAKVMNLSLGGLGACGVTEQAAITAAINAGAVVVVSAGNSNVDLASTAYTPATCTGVITVAATGPTGGRSYYSNYGATVEIAAPGGDTSGGAANGVLSTIDTGASSQAAYAYGYKQGTSMAAPHVTGVVSLLFSVVPTLTPAEVLSSLQSTARTFTTGNVSDCTTSTCGSGIVAANTLLSLYSSTVSISASQSESREAGLQSGVLSVTRGGSTSSSLTVQLSISGTATEGTDYVSLGSSVVIPAGSSEAVLQVTPIGDTATSEGTETIVVALAAGSGYSILSPSSATVSLVDDTSPSTQSSSTPSLNQEKKDILKDFDCPIQRSVQGTAMESHLGILRAFRGNTLMPVWYGRAFTRAYYRIGRIISPYVQKYEWPKKIIRSLVSLSVKWIERYE